MTTIAGAPGVGRAQSEVVGVVILVGVFATVATIVGVVIVGNVSDQADDGPLTDLNASGTAQNVTLVHGGGDPVDADAVEVILRRDDTERYTLTSFSEVSGDGDGRFEPGEKRRRGHSFSAGQVRVIVVHEPSNSVLHEETIQL